MFPGGFQVVIFAAGKGSRMTEITANIPKCLLPIANKPLVWYPLQMLENCGFKDVILIVTESQKLEIQNTLEKTDLKIKIDYFLVAANEDLGTADSLRLLDDKITSDVICISCDMVTDLDLHDAIEMFGKHDASIVSVFFQPQNNGDWIVPGPKTKHKPERDFVGVDSETNRLVLLASASDFEENLTLKKSLLNKHTNIKLYSSLTDAHIYIMKNWVCRYLQHETNFSTIKGELIPHIIKKQMFKQPKSIDDKTASIINTDTGKDIFQFAKETELEIKIRNSSTYNDHTGDLKSCYHGNVVRCFAHISDKNVFGLRINNVSSYWNVINNILTIWPKVTFGKELIMKDVKAEIQSNQVDENCIIWEGAKLSEKTSFKSSLIGPNSEVQSKTRVFNSVVMNNVVIKERCAIQNCIISAGAVIESGCNLKDCLIGAQHVVPEDSEHSRELLTDSDKLMEFE